MDDDGAIVGEIVDRPLTRVELKRISKGKEPVGNGSRPSFADLPPATVLEYQRRSLETRRLKAQGRKLAELEGYIEAHRENAAMLFGAKLAIIEGLLAEMRVPNAEGEVTYKTERLDSKRLQVLGSFLTQWEDRSFGRVAQKVEQSGTVNVSHQVAKLAEQLKRGDD